MIERRRPTASSPLASLVAGLFMLGLGVFGARTELRIHTQGHRVLARIASVSVSGGRHRSSTTHLTFSTLAGAASECTIAGSLGDVGRPVWIRYLPSDPERSLQIADRDSRARPVGPRAPYDGFEPVDSSTGSQCAQDDLRQSMGRSILMCGFGALLLAGSFVLYRRTQRGESVRR